MNFNLVISTILLIPYAVKADAELETLDASGTKCSTKLSLCELDPGKITSLGLKGDKGDKGDIGPAGEPGTCDCGSDSIPGIFRGGSAGETDSDMYDDIVMEWGTYLNPGNTTCKNAPIDITDTYYINDSIEVVCDVNKRTTCVQIHAHEQDASFSDLKPSWLSIEGIDYRDHIYNLSNSQLEWLQARSDTASIKIKYHCINTNPARKDKEVLLLSWNDVIIGPQFTASTPVHYTVEKNGCASSPKDEWAFADIVIKNTSAHRLPIIDFYIQDTEQRDQKHKITVTELCFY